MPDRPTLPACPDPDDASGLNRRVLEQVQALARVGVVRRELSSMSGHWDRAMFEILGLDPSQGPPSFEQLLAMVHQEDRASVQQALARARDGEQFEHDYRVLLADGELRRLRARFTLIGRDADPELLVVIQDDTERYRLNQALAELGEQLRLSTELGEIAVWRHELDSQRLFCNATGWQLLGLAPSGGSDEGVSLATAWARVHPEDLQRVQQSHAAALASGQPSEMVARYRHADGSWRHLRVRRSAQRNVHGELSGFVGVALDVTAEIEDGRAADALRRQLEQTAAVVGLGMWRRELASQRLSWNAEMFKLYGLPPDREPSRSAWLDRVHPDDRERAAAEFGRLLEQPGELREIEYRILLPDGELRWLVDRARCEPPVAGRGGSVSGILMDITARRSAEAALDDARDRAALAARGAGIATWEFNARSGQLFWDEQMYRLRELEPRPQPPDHAEVLALLHPDDRHKAMRFSDEAQLSSELSRREFRVRLPDGSYRWLASRSSAVRDAEGRVLKRIGLNWDINEAKLSAEANEARALAQRASQAKSEFLARVSHELRTPLNAVLGFAQLLQMEGALQDPRAAAVKLGHIRSAGEHLLALINDVLDLSRLESGDMRIDRRPLLLAELVGSTLPLVEAQARAQGVALQLGALPGRVLGDETRLRQVLLNLLSNAIKYNRPGGTVSLSAQRRPDGIALSISDTGRGLDEQQLQAIFQPFNRLGLEQGSIEGTGIGLAIVKALLERMGGRISVQSRLGAGSTFTANLPEAPDVTESSPSPDSAAAPQQFGDRPGRLLYIEDNPVNQLVVQELVAQRPRLELVCEEDGGRGLARAQSMQPDLILLDMQLPDFDGYQVLQRLRADARTADIPCIALSANAMPEDIRRAREAGFADYWTKPIDFKAFLNGLDALFAPRP